MDNQWERRFEHVLLTITSVGQIILATVFYSHPVIELWRNIGWVCLWTSAVFGWLPIFTFKKFGGVKDKDSYVKTSILVTRGVYSIVRHPQYLAGILISLGLFMIAPHWSNFTLGFFNAILYISGIFQEEKKLIDKFGDAYREYMQRVPRLNFIWGLIKKLLGAI